MKGNMSHGAEMICPNPSRNKGAKMSPLQKLESLAGRIFYWGPRSEAGAPAGSEMAHVSEHTAAWNEQSELGWEPCW